MVKGTGLIRLALFGHPVRHSLSPRIHRAFARQAGLKVSYRALEVHSGTLALALDAFAATGGTGCNITLPLKQEAMGLAAQCSDQVLRAQAANTLVRQNDGSWQAENTDGAGLVHDLDSDRRFQLQGARIALLGAGGAAAGILEALLTAGPAEIMIINRTVEKAERLAASHADLGKVSGSGPSGHSGYDLVINATSLGHHGGLPLVNQELFAAEGACYDLNYGPAADPLREWCRERRIPYRDGLGMLVEQAAESFVLWTGYAPDAVPVLAALRHS